MCVRTCVHIRIHFVVFILDVGNLEKEQKQELHGMEGICITHSCIPLCTVYLQHIIISHSGGIQEWVIQIPSIPILVSVPFKCLE